MGLVGGPHCLVMCAAPCHAITRSREGSSVAYVQSKSLTSSGSFLNWNMIGFHTGRLLGYGLLGAIAAQAMEQMAWLSDRTSVLHPIWVLMHLAVLAWGLLMLFQAQQPLWLERTGRSVWAKVQPIVSMRGGVLLAGMAWALMPCGLLYSAVLVAALSGEALAGAVSMVAFGLGGAIWLWGAPYVWHWLSGRIAQFRAEWGVRVAGGMLVIVSAWALWMDLVYTPSLWCR